ncbi:citryl-CoA lyase [Burkholderia territorii]|uniref:Citryl-CoA lyase n=1 Tax=Burkholderia territorii TaxID=1503055 RepID=A0A107K152_9BURK|nr:CoA ester lyase [Burkholderia territorii]KWE88963.1 citryl-CoA lyase [Burkholderia territorii]KWN11208.1 citryl-CoA lyase [Burkholderia territorii]KWO54259.1 citryl-CoA lyase [Burkholderia territorii]
MKSKLFVPGSRPDLFDKALNGPADAVSFDLEDAVAEDRKDAARAALRARLDQPLPPTKTIVVRVNALGTRGFDADLDAVARPGVAIVNLPKPRDPDDVRAAAAALERAERRNGVTTPIRLLVNIETPRALRLASELAAADPRVIGLQLGLGDLFEPLGIDRRETAALVPVMLAVRIAAGEAGIAAYDAAFADIGDADGFRSEASLARRLGFAGKSCIHPTQVDIANDVFRPTLDEIRAALRVLDAERRAVADGRGAYVVDGRMIDAPFVARARTIVSEAIAFGLIPPEGIAQPPACLAP